MHDFVFVYGTLRKGDCRGNLGGSVHFTEAYIEGFNIFDLGSFPGIRPGNGRVRGEVHQIDDEILQRLDWIEGYNPENPSQGLYDRHRVQAQDPNGETVEAWAYIYNNRRGEDLEPIPSGDWFEHKNLYQEEECQNTV